MIKQYHTSRYLCQQHPTNQIGGPDCYNKVLKLLIVRQYVKSQNSLGVYHWSRMVWLCTKASHCERMWNTAFLKKDFETHPFSFCSELVSLHLLKKRECESRDIFFEVGLLFWLSYPAQYSLIKKALQMFKINKKTKWTKILVFKQSVST